MIQGLGKIVPSRKGFREKPSRLKKSLCWSNYKRWDTRCILSSRGPLAISTPKAWPKDQALGGRAVLFTLGTGGLPGSPSFPSGHGCISTLKAQRFKRHTSQIASSPPKLQRTWERGLFGGPSYFRVIYPLARDWRTCPFISLRE